MQKSIRENVQALLNEIPSHVQLEAAAKSRTADEIREAIEAGVKIIGENYIQEASDVYGAVTGRARFHFIGHLQKNKVKKAVRMFDMIETVDTQELAREIEKCCASLNRQMPVLIEINSGHEPQKWGVFPEMAEPLVRSIMPLGHIIISGLMTMGPLTGEDKIRDSFRITRTCFEHIRSLKLPAVDMRILSMGMTDSFRIAIEEGANLVRIGTGLFGERKRQAG